MNDTGNRTVSVDEKGRIIIPQDYRDIFSGRVLLTDCIVGGERCIRCSSVDGYEPETPEQSFASFIGQTDINGRITIPEACRRYAGLERAACLGCHGNDLYITTPEAMDKIIDSLYE